ncbi:uncharacterized protein LOC123670578 isoform X2 [Harmonia axyridis]|uniref:uncharacterized protein LOC123670578 isoform X2 n=1 Tax=Harmonia axyridis TaxID=115357 RepID=UPI001E277F24|nr:uncharacterized protein LOC123670578 isoform X2 [Harmonia axyridis]
MPDYIRIDSDSSSATWGSLTGLEKKLILLSVILGILLLAFMILLGINVKRCDDSPSSNSTTIAPTNGTTPSSDGTTPATSTISDETTISTEDPSTTSSISDVTTTPVPPAPNSSSKLTLQTKGICSFVLLEIVLTVMFSIIPAYRFIL